MPLNSESIAYWYFRMNGFFTFKNFIVHPEAGAEPRTEADVFGIRLPYRRELLGDPMVDDDRFTRFRNKSVLVIGEVKLGVVAINMTWRRPELGNVESFLRAAGAFPLDRVGDVATAIYETGAYEDASYKVYLVGIGTKPSPVLAKMLPGVLQVTWREIAIFIFNRFSRHHLAKMAHRQWDESGQELWRTWATQANSNDFATAIQIIVDAERPAPVSTRG